MNKNKNKPKL